MASESDPITVIQVVDTAIKIGLGALIAGVSTYVIARLNHKRDVEKDNLKRKRELLEKVAFDIESHWNTYRRYYIVCLDYVQRLKKNESDQEELHEDFNKKSKSVTENSDSLSSALSILLLLGENKAHEKVIEYAKLSQDFMIKTNDPKNAPSAVSLEQFHNLILESRNEIFEKLSLIYRKIGF